MKIAFLSSFPPKTCGVGEFCLDLITNIKDVSPAADISVYAIDDQEKGYDYTPIVKDHFYCNKPEDYTRIAQAINRSDSQICINQHEYNLYGGDENEYFFNFTDAIKKPLINIMHNIPIDKKHRKYGFRVEHLKRIKEKTAMFVTTSEYGKSALMEYGIPVEKITVILHGAPAMPPQSDRPVLKQKLGIRDYFTVAEIGIMSERKNVKQIIEAIALVKTKVPNIKCLVIGPKASGLDSNYLESMKIYAQSLGVENNLEFIEKYFQPKALYEYLVACDATLTPYYKVDQISSGPLTFSLAAGTPVISTPFLSAKELLKNTGILVPFLDTKALADSIIKLATDKDFYISQKERTISFGKTLSWNLKAKEYLDMMQKLLNSYR